MDRQNSNRRNRDSRDDYRDSKEDQNYAPYRNEHDADRNDRNREGNYYRDNDWYRTNDYNNRNDNQPPYSQRNEEWYRHTYGLPANGGNLRDQNRHDIGQWGNSNFSQNSSNREYNRINDRFDRDETRRDENSRSEGDYYNNLNRYYTGEHRGKGPKGYSRSDDRIKDDINDRLTDDAHIDASDIEVSVSKGEVTLTGTVADRSSKRRAEDIAELVSGVTHVENRLRIKSATMNEKQPSSSTTSGTNGHYSDKKKATAL